MLIKRSLVVRSCVGWGGGVEMTREDTAYLGATGTILSDTIMVETCHYTFVKTYIVYNIKDKP